MSKLSVFIHNRLRNPYHLNTGLPGITHVDVAPGQKVHAEIHEDQKERLEQLGMVVEEGPAPKAARKPDTSDVNPNVAAGVQAGDKNTVDPAQRALVAAATGDPRDLQGTSHVDGDLTGGQQLARDMSGATEESFSGSATTEDGDSIPRLLAEVDAKTVPYAQLRSRAKALLGDDFPLGSSPKQDEIVDLLKKRQRKDQR